MKLTINIEKKHFFGLLVLGLIVLGVAGVFAYNAGGSGGNPSVFGHSADEVDWSQAISKNVTATGFCIGTDCRTAWWPTSSAPSGVTKLIAGAGISVSAETGDVTVGIPAGAIGTNLIADSSVTDSKISSVSWSKITGAPAAGTIGDKSCYWAPWVAFGRSTQTSGCQTGTGEYVRQIQVYWPTVQAAMQIRVECCGF